MTTVVIEQPNYIPWIGYFDLIRQSDVWVWYDEVQYTKRDWRNRNCVAAGHAREWLTIPVRNKGRFHQPIREVEIDWSQPWTKIHLGTIRRCYARAPHYSEVVRLMEAAFDARPLLLADLTIALNESICTGLDMKTSFRRSSSLPRSSEERTQRLLELCRAWGATTYLSGPAARAYLVDDPFRDAGITVRYIAYDYPAYARGERPFVPNLSIVDTLAWIGSRGVVDLLANGRMGGN